MENPQTEVRRTMKIETTNRATFLGSILKSTTYEKETIENPSWEQVLQTINLMGKDKLKNIEVILFSDVKGATLWLVYYDDRNSSLDSAYGVSVYGIGSYVLFDPERKHGDQFFQNYIEGSTDFGFELESTAVDYRLMLQATKFFYDYGFLDPTLNWWNYDELDAIREQYTDKWWAEVQGRQTSGESGN